MDGAALLEDVADRLAIGEVLTAYCLGVDRVDYDLVRACYTPDAWDDHGLYAGPIDGYIKWMKDSALSTIMQTMHSVSNVHIELGGDGTAKSESYVFALHRMKSSRNDYGVADHWVGARYLDDWKRTPDLAGDGALREARGWRIQRRRVVWDWSRSDPLTREWKLPPDTLRFRRDGSDPSYGHCAWQTDK
jgi:hypothetical protein